MLPVEAETVRPLPKLELQAFATGSARNVILKFLSWLGMWLSGGALATRQMTLGSVLTK